MKTVKWVKTGSKLFVHAEGKQIAVTKTDPIYKRLFGYLMDDKEDAALGLLFPTKRVVSYSDANFTVDNEGNLFLKGEDRPVNRVIGEKLIAFSKKGLPYMALVNFCNNLKLNPSEISKDQLYGFLSKNKHPITNDGYFIAYKKVKYNTDGKLVDCYTGTIINNIGQIVKVARDEVDPDRNVTCSNGLHVASFDYAMNHYSGDVLLIVLVNPRDIVAVPRDYHEMKCRCCEYQVIGIESQEIQSLYISQPIILRRLKDALKKNEHFDFNDMSASRIISFVKMLTGEKIKISVNSKKDIVKKATEIFVTKKLLADNLIAQNM